MKSKLSLLVVMVMVASYVLPLGAAIAAPGGKSAEVKAEKQVKENSVNPSEDVKETKVTKVTAAQPAAKPAKDVKEAPVQAKSQKAKKATVKSQPTPEKTQPVAVASEPVSIFGINIAQEDIGRTSTGPARWTFVVSGLAPGSEVGLTAVFKNAGEIGAKPSKVTDTEQVFYIDLPAADKLGEAYANALLPEFKEGITLYLASIAPIGSENDPAGNNGTVKIDGIPFDDAPDNEPHVGCVFQVDFYGFDAGDKWAEVIFELIPPTGSKVVLTDKVFIGEDAAGGGTDLDASKTYNLRTLLAESGIEPHEIQGYHLKLTVHADGSQGADTKHKVFWVKCNVTPPPPCDEETETPTPPPTLKPKPPTKTVTVTTTETEEGDTQLPYTGSAGALTLTVALGFAVAGGILRRKSMI